MAKYSSIDFTFEIDSSDSGALQALTPHITEFGDIAVSRGSVESTPFGTSAAEYLGAIVKRWEPIMFSGKFDNTATTGPDFALNIGRYTHAVTRSFKITLGPGTPAYTITGECWITDYKRKATIGEYTTYECTVQPTGTITEAGAP